MACPNTTDELPYSLIMLRHSSDDDTAARSAHTDEAGEFETRSRRNSSVMRSESTTPANTLPLVQDYGDNEVEAAYPSNAKPTLNRPPQSPMGELDNPKPYKNTSGDWWEWELFGIVGSAVALGGIILVLCLFQDKPQPSWEHISLNALISWLSTVAKLLVLIPTSRSLGQLKWVWFKQRHMPLLDMEVFDSASRGVMGSFSLLWRLQCQHTAALGALVTVLAIGMDPFIQNLLRYYQKASLDIQHPASISNISYYDVSSPERAWDNAPDLGLKLNVLNSLYDADPSESWAQPYYVCPSGNCTWNDIATLGFSATCNNTSAGFETKCGTLAGDISNCSVTLADGFGLWYSATESSTSNYSTRLVMAEGEYYRYGQRGYLPFFSLRSVYASGLNFLSNESAFISTECTLELNVRVFDASVETLNASTGSSYKETLTASYPLNINMTDKVIDEVIDNQTFGMSSYSLSAIYIYLQDILEGYVLRVTGVPVVASLDTNFTEGLDHEKEKADALQAIYLGNFSRCSNPDHKVECAVKNVARALTKSLRDAAYMANGTSGANMAMGETYVPVTHVGVRWYWMALPVTVWILSVVTFLGTVWTTRQANAQPWRNSPIPLLFLDIDQGERRSLWEDGVSNDACLRKAEQLNGKLEIEEDGATLFTHST